MTDFCERCGRHPVECGCEPDPAMIEHAPTRVLPPRHTWVPRVFVRADRFYIIDLPDDEDLNLHANLNPGTVEILDAITGQRLWPEGSMQ